MSCCGVSPRRACPTDCMWAMLPCTRIDTVHVPEAPFRRIGVLMFLAEDDPESKPLCLPKSYPDVMVVQSRQDGDGYNEPGPLDCPTEGRVFAQLL